VAQLATDLRDNNRASVLRLIAQRRPIARNEIAETLGLSTATVTSITRELISGGVVEIVEQAPSRGGRPALRLGLVSTAASAIGVKVASDHVVAVRLDLDGKVVAELERPFSPGPQSVQVLGKLLHGFIESWTGGGVTLGVGVGVPGIVRANGVVVSPMLGFDELPFADELVRELELPVLVDNDVNTLAVAERLYGRGRDLDSFLTLTLGRGVGLGLVLHGAVYRGRGGAGEFGHTVVEPEGPECECGNRGCLEALVSDPALVWQGRQAGVIGPRQGIAALRTAADRGDARALGLFAQAGARLGRAVSILANSLHPELVLVSGEGTLSWPHFEPTFMQSFTASTFAPLRDVRVEVDPWDDKKWAMGAAALVLEAPFEVTDGEVPEAVRARLLGPVTARRVA
jgi:predicted NBD/HSP70 family sugar kinase